MKKRGQPIRLAPRDTSMMLLLSGLQFCFPHGHCCYVSRIRIPGYLDGGTVRDDLGEEIGNRSGWHLVVNEIGAGFYRNPGDGQRSSHGILGGYRPAQERPDFQRVRSRILKVNTGGNNVAVCRHITTDLHLLAGCHCGHGGSAGDDHLFAEQGEVGPCICYGVGGVNRSSHDGVDPDVVIKHDLSGIEDAAHNIAFRFNLHADQEIGLDPADECRGSGGVNLLTVHDEIIRRDELGNKALVLFLFIFRGFQHIFQFHLGRCDGASHCASSPDFYERALDRTCRECDAAAQSHSHAGCGIFIQLEGKGSAGEAGDEPLGFKFGQIYFLFNVGCPDLTAVIRQAAESHFIADCKADKFSRIVHGDLLPQDRDKIHPFVIDGTFQSVPEFDLLGNAGRTVVIKPALDADDHTRLQKGGNFGLALEYPVRGGLIVPQVELCAGSLEFNAVDEEAAELFDNPFAEAAIYDLEGNLGGCHDAARNRTFGFQFPAGDDISLDASQEHCLGIGLDVLSVQDEVASITAGNKALDRHFLVLGCMQLVFHFQLGSSDNTPCRGKGLDLYERAGGRKRRACRKVHCYPSESVWREEKGKAGGAPRDQLDITFGLEFGNAGFLFQVGRLDLPIGVRETADFYDITGNKAGKLRRIVNGNYLAHNHYGVMDEVHAVNFGFQ